MCRVFAALPALLLVAACLSAAPGEPAPLWPADLLREAKTASPPVAEILRELAAPAEVEKTAIYEKVVLERVRTLLATPDASQGTWAAEKALRAALRYSLSRVPDDSSAGLRTELSDKLLDVRVQLLAMLPDGDDLAPALKSADVWLPLYTPQSRLGATVHTLWIAQAKQQLKLGHADAARRCLDRVEATFVQSPESEILRKELQGRAAALLEESRKLPDGNAQGLLEKALLLSPRMPGLRDELEKRRHQFQILDVAVRDLPEYLSPAMAWSDSERQVVELIFEGLVHARHDATLGARYWPVLAERLTTGTGTRRPLDLRRDAFWSDGERFTDRDVRHTVQLLTQSGQAGGNAWHDLLEPPRLGENRFGLDVVYRQGLLDPWAPLCFKLLPQHAHGKPLDRADSIDFAKQPIGSGPYQFHGREGADGRVSVVLRANPRYVRAGQPSPGTIRTLRFFAWRDGDGEPGKPLPHLALDVLPSQIALLKKQGYTDFRNLSVPRVWFLGLNHRRPPFANLQVRLALAQAVDRHGLLDRHFRTELPGATALSVNGLFPRGSWANGPASRVPFELFRPEEARAAARKIGKDLVKAEWTLKYPDGDPRLHAALKELAENVSKVLAGGDAKIVIRPVPLSPRQMQQAVRERDYDLIYRAIELPESPLALGSLFDSHPDAVAPGGSNFLGYDQDARLQEFLSAARHHRDFTAVRRIMQDIHQRLFDAMPVIPLWQLPYPVAVHGKLHAPNLDPLAVFGNVLDWTMDP